MANNPGAFQPPQTQNAYLVTVPQHYNFNNFGSGSNLTSGPIPGQSTALVNPITLHTPSPPPPYPPVFVGGWPPNQNLGNAAAVAANHQQPWAVLTPAPPQAAAAARNQNEEQGPNQRNPTQNGNGPVPRAAAVQNQNQGQVANQNPAQDGNAPDRRQRARDRRTQRRREDRYNRRLVAVMRQQDQIANNRQDRQAEAGFVHHHDHHHQHHFPQQRQLPRPAPGPPPPPPRQPIDPRLDEDALGVFRNFFRNGDRANWRDLIEARREVVMLHAGGGENGVALRRHWNEAVGRAVALVQERDQQGRRGQEGGGGYYDVVQPGTTAAQVWNTLMVEGTGRD